MAITTESANRVRQKTYMINRNAGVFYALKALFLHLAANKGNPDLQIVNIDGNATASDGGNVASQVVANAACTLYAIYLKKSGAALTVFKGTDNATTASSTAEDVECSMTTKSEENLLLFPSGHACANGFTYTENTTQSGSTLNLLANRIDGFVILGA